MSPAAALRPLREDPAVRLILAVFVISRLLYYLAGVRFQTDLLAFNFQFIDIGLLKTRLLESLYYFHMQPPLMNSGIGILIKLFPTHYGTAQHVIQIGFGAIAGILLYRAMISLSVSARLATVLSLLFITAPGTLLFENFPMYEYTIMTVLLAAAIFLYKFVGRPTALLALLFFSALAALCYIRSLYHIGYFLALAAVLWIYVPRGRRAVLLGAVLPFSLVLLLYLKNYALFGLFSSSSWLGSNLATCTTHQLTDAEKAMLARSGKVSEIGFVEPMSPPGDYVRFVGQAPPTGIAVLDQDRKSTGGINYNSMTFLRIDPLYRAAAFQILRHYPLAYIRSVVIAWFCYFLPPGDFFQFEPNRALIRPIDRLYNTLLYGQFLEASRKDLRNLRSQGHGLSLVLYTGMFLMLLLPAILIASAVYVVRSYRTSGMTKAQTALAGFLWVSIVHIMLLSNFLSSFENNRYRFPTDPLYVALLGMLIQRAWTAFGKRSERAVCAGGARAR